MDEHFASVGKGMKRVTRGQAAIFLLATKYHNEKTEVDGLKFDSRKEANRWCELQLMQKAGEIYELQRQVPFVVLPAQRDENGKLIEREVKYVADFTYREKGVNRLVVEDTKSKATKTPEYIIKRKLMLYRLGLRIREV